MANDNFEGLPDSEKIKYLKDSIEELKNLFENYKKNVKSSNSELGKTDNLFKNIGNKLSDILKNIK